MAVDYGIDLLADFAAPAGVLTEVAEEPGGVVAGVDLAGEEGGDDDLGLCVSLIEASVGEGEGREELRR